MASSDNSQNHDSNTLIALLSDIRDILRNQEARLSRIEDASAPKDGGAVGSASSPPSPDTQLSPAQPGPTTSASGLDHSVRT
jgi:uncharacterized membrane protein YccC